MARLTFKDNVPNSVAVAAFSGRLGALSQAHEMLVHNQWSGAQLRDLIEKQLAPHIRGNEGRFKVEGPTAMLPRSSRRLLRWPCTNLPPTRSNTVRYQNQMELFP